MSTENKSINATAWAFIDKIVYTGIQFVISIVLARLLSPNDYGVVALLLVFVSLGQVFIDSGFGNGLIRKESCTREDYNTAFVFNIIVSILVYLMLFVAAPFISNFYKVEILSSVLRIYGLSLIINSFSIVPNSILTRGLSFKKMAKCRLLCGVISGVVAIVMAYLGYGVWALVGQTLLTSLVYSLAVNIETKWSPRVVFNYRSFNYLWGFGSKMLLSGLLSSIYSNIYSLVIGRFYSKADLGYFNRGNSLGNILPEIIQSSFGKSIFPLLSQQKSDKSALFALYRKYTKVVSLISFPCIIFSAVFARPFILLLLTQKWNGAIFYMQVFSLACLMAPVGMINMNLLMALGRSDIMLRADIVKKTIGIIVVLILVRFSVRTLAVGSLVLEFLIYFVNLYYVKKTTNIPYFGQIADMFPFIMVALFSGLIAFFPQLFVENYLLQIVLGGVLGTSCYYIILKFIVRSESVLQLESVVIGAIRHSLHV